jgi:hypothetical protein
MLARVVHVEHGRVEVEARSQRARRTPSPAQIAYAEDVIVSANVVALRAKARGKRAGCRRLRVASHGSCAVHIKPAASP